MRNINKRKKLEKRYILLITVVAIIVMAIIIFVQFTSLGYRITVPLRNFTEASPNVYIHNNYANDKKDVVKIVDEAKERVTKYFGQTKSNPMIIICDDKGTIAKLGGDHDTATVAIFKVYSYIAVSSEFLEVDIVAHEMTHAETHARIFDGKLGFKPLVPLWFDEGVALQNDYRERYNEDAWKEATDNGKNVVALSDIATPANFYAGEVEERRYRYIVSKHEVSDWIKRNGIGDLFNLLDKVNQGIDFDSLYFAE